MKKFKRTDERQRVWAISMVGDIVDTQGDYFTDLGIEDAVAKMLTRPNKISVKIDHSGQAE